MIEPNQLVEVNGITFSHDDIYRVVDDFYTRIQSDPILQVPFKSVHDWPDHIRNLTHFWWMRFGGKPYLFHAYNPAAKHFYAGFNRDLLKRWLDLFHQTLQTQLAPEQVMLWKLISERMGESLNAKNERLTTEHSRTGLGPRR